MKMFKARESRQSQACCREIFAKNANGSNFQNRQCSNLPTTWNETWPLITTIKSKAFLGQIETWDLWYMISYDNISRWHCEAWTQPLLQNAAKMDSIWANLDLGLSQALRRMQLECLLCWQCQELPYVIRSDLQVCWQHHYTCHPFLFSGDLAHESGKPWKCKIYINYINIQHLIPPARPARLDVRIPSIRI